MDDMTYPKYSDVSQHGSVPYDSVKEFFSNVSYWNTVSEDCMFEWIWGCCEKEGLTKYSNRYEYYTVAIYAICIAFTYMNFCYTIHEPDFYYEFPYADYCCDLLSDYQIGVLYGRLEERGTRSSDYDSPLIMFDYDINDALEELVGECRWKVIDKISPRYPDLFWMMYCTNVDFTNTNSEGYSAENYRKDVESLSDAFFDNTPVTVDRGWIWIG